MPEMRVSGLAAATADAGDVLTIGAIILTLATLTLIFAINQGQPIKTLTFHHNADQDRPEWMTHVVEFDSLEAMALTFIESFTSTNVRMVIWLISVIEHLLAMIPSFDPCAFFLSWIKDAVKAVGAVLKEVLKWYTDLKSAFDWLQKQLDSVESGASSVWSTIKSWFEYHDKLMLMSDADKVKFLASPHPPRMHLMSDSELTNSTTAKMRAILSDFEEFHKRVAVQGWFDGGFDWDSVANNMTAAGAMPTSWTTMGISDQVDNAEDYINNIVDGISCTIDMKWVMEQITGKIADCEKDIENSWQDSATIEEGGEAIIKAAENYGAFSCGPIGYVAQLMLTTWSFAFNYIFKAAYDSGIVPVDLGKAFSSFKNTIINIADYMDEGFHMLAQDMDLDLNLDVFTNFGIQLNTNPFTLPSGWVGTLIVIGVFLLVLVLVVLSDDFVILEMPLALARNALISASFVLASCIVKLRSFMNREGVTLAIVWSDVAWIYELSVGLFIVGFIATIMPGTSRERTRKYTNVKLAAPRKITKNVG